MNSKFKNVKFLNTIIIILCKSIYWFINTLKLGSGSTWPGHIALNLNKNFIKESLTRLRPTKQGFGEVSTDVRVSKINSQLKMILIAGTNGKTTTSTLIKFILERSGKRVFQNEEGANLLNGIASAIIKNSDFWGKLNYDFAVFEVDENSLPLALKEINPFSLIILNLFRDQLDRYGEVNTIALKWREVLLTLSSETALIINGDDPQLSYIGQSINKRVFFFGLDESEMKNMIIGHDVDSIYCPKCNKMLDYRKVAYSHLGVFSCNHCDFKRPSPELEQLRFSVKNFSLKGLYNLYNLRAVLTLFVKVLNFKIDQIIKLLNDFQPAFGRQEIINYQERKFQLLLSKNPTGFNQSIEVAKEIIGEGKANLLLVLNDRIPDGRDVSWIWDVDMENITELRGKHHGITRKLTRIFVSGDRVFDMGLRLKYAGIKDFIIEKNLNKAVKELVKKTKKDEKILVLATYTGMLEVRKILLGRKLL